MHSSDENKKPQNSLEEKLGHRGYVMLTQPGVKGDLYDRLTSVEYIPYETKYKDLSSDQLFSEETENAYWDDPVEALKEVIDRTLKDDPAWVHYAACSFMYHTIPHRTEFWPLFTEGQYWTLKYTFNDAEANMPLD